MHKAIMFSLLLAFSGNATASQWQAPVNPGGYAVGEEYSPPDNDADSGATTTIDENILENSDNIEATPDGELVQDNTPKWLPAPQATLKALDKILTKNKELHVKTGGKQKFGSLDISIEKCFRVPDSDKEESSALIRITETLSNGTSKEVFYAWMFSSSPALSALEHPIYDVILLSCNEMPAKKKEEQKDEDKKKDDKKGDKKKDDKKSSKNKR